jgi:hypothetical protein
LAVFAATQDFGGAGVSDLQTRIARAAAELGAMIERRPVASRQDEVAGLPAGVAPFAQLLRG